MVVVWPLMVCGTAFATYLIITNQEAIATTLGFGFASTVLLSCINIFSGVLVHLTVRSEAWHPKAKTNVRRPLTRPPRPSLHAGGVQRAGTLHGNRQQRMTGIPVAQLQQMACCLHVKLQSGK